MKSNAFMATLCASAVIFTSIQPAHAFFGRKKPDPNPTPVEALNITTPPAQAQQELAVLQALASSMTQRLQSIENQIAAGQTKEALALAKETLDDVRVKTGIDPKAKLRQNFLVPITFPEGASNMNSLSDDQKEIVIRTVRDFRGGLYLDILNLSKRTSLLYIKALHAELSRSGGLNSEDRNKIIKDLTVASIVPMPIQDRAGKKITAFDDDVANEDHVYLFNREIKSYLLNAKDLQITEAIFDKYKADYKTSLGGYSSITSGNTKVSNDCTRYVGSWVVGYSEGLGKETFDYAVRMCKQYNNFTGQVYCINSYNSSVAGHTEKVGFTVFENAVKYCLSK